MKYKFTRNVQIRIVSYNWDADHTRQRKINARGTNVNARCTLPQDKDHHRRNSNIIF